MPTVPNRPKRRADVVGSAIKAARIATREDEDVFDVPHRKERCGG